MRAFLLALFLIGCTPKSESFVLQDVRFREPVRTSFYKSCMSVFPLSVCQCHEYYAVQSLRATGDFDFDQLIEQCNVEVGPVLAPELQLYMENIEEPPAEGRST